MNFNLRAFSLIELAIVILVLGVLISGIVKGSKVIRESKLQASRYLTKGSPVSNIEGLALWLETTQDNSFNGSETVDGTTLTIWKDINPQTTNKLFAIKISGSPKYIESSPINDLPSVYTAGGVFSISTQSSSVINSYIATPNNAFTVFIVHKKDVVPSGQGQYLFNADTWYYGTAGGNNKNHFASFGSGVISEDVDANNKFPTISTLIYEGGTSGLGYHYSNGSLIGSSTLSIAVPDDAFYIGGRGANYRTWKGHLSEMIIYGKELKSKDRKLVEEYLGKKYNIAVAGAS